MKKIQIAIVVTVILAFLAPAAMAQGNRALWSMENYIQSAKIHYKHVYVGQGKERKELYHCIDLIREAADKYGHVPELYHMLGTFYAEINAIDTMVAYFDSVQMFCDDESVDENYRKKCYKKDKFIEKIEKLRQDSWERSYNDGVDFLTQYDTAAAWLANAPNEDSAKVLDSIKNVAYGLAKDNFEAALLVKPADPRTYDGLAVLLEREENHTEAVELYEQAIDILGETPSLISKIAYAYIYIPDWENAITWFEKHLEHEPEDVNSLINLSVAYNAISNYEKWYEYTERVLELQPDNTQFLFNAGQYWFMQMQDAASKIAEITDSTPDAETTRAELDNRAKEAREKAIHYFQENIEIDPEDTDAMMRLGILYLISGMNEEAVNTLENYVAIDSSKTDVLDYLGRGYINLGEMESAIRPYELIIDNDPGNVDAWERLAELYAIAKMPEKAEEAKSHAAELKKL